jgi:hypothetical protein
MYSPKIREDLIPRLYRLAKSRKRAMTILVNDLLQKAVDELEASQTPSVCPTPPAAGTRRTKKGGAR